MAQDKAVPLMARLLFFLLKNTKFDLTLRNGAGKPIPAIKD